MGKDVQLLLKNNYNKFTRNMQMIIYTSDAERLERHSHEDRGNEI